MKKTSQLLIKLQAEITGYKLHVKVDGVNGFKAVEREKPDLVLLDIMLPGQNGFDVCRKIKNHPDLKSIPVIILTAKSEELDVILGLELALMITSRSLLPKVLFSPKSKQLLRRSKDDDLAANTHSVLTFGKFTLETERYLLKKADKIITLTLSEFGILKRLLSHRGKVLTRNQLSDDIHNDDAFIVDRNIDVHIASLRKKLGPNFDWIETVRGIGYRFRR
jgi:two-component system alkaline phosphatase synthesis response regulator PhoP